MYVVDKEKGIAIVKNDSVVTRHLRFSGRILAGLRVIFWGNIEASEVYLGKGCIVMGDILCDKAVIGACTKFNRVIANEYALIQSKCFGRYVKAKNVQIAEGCVIGEVEADENIIIDGNSRLGRLNARKILAFSNTEGSGCEAGDSQCKS
jgi:cytoskeletal protein CcmA (bactofilin family)